VEVLNDATGMSDAAKTFVDIKQTLLKKLKNVKN
jgi:hypothetical protein